jgi:ketosteroid isomerase-like protein
MREFAMSFSGCVGALAFAVTAVAGPRDEVLTAVASWSSAVVANDPRAVGEFVADDWTLIAADGHVMTKASFMRVMASGELVHDRMTLASPVVRLYGDVAIVSGVATTTGAYRGERFATHERSTDVFIWRNGRWRCVLTQLTATGAAETTGVMRP